MNIYPYVGAEDISPKTRLYWIGGDPDTSFLKGRVNYCITIHNQTSFIEQYSTSNEWVDVNLEYNQTYYWRVTATDFLMKKNTSNEWHFSTKQQD